MINNGKSKLVELSSLNPKKKHDYKMTNEIESVRLESNHIVIEGFCFLRKVNPKRITNIQILFEDQSARERKVLLFNDLENKQRKDVTYIFAGKHDNYDYAGFRLRFRAEDLPAYNKYKNFKLHVMFEVDGRNVILPFTKNHSTLGKNKMPDLGNVSVSYRKHFFLVLNEDKTTSKKYEAFKDRQYVKAKAFYQNLPIGAKKGYLRNTLIFMKKKILR